jgi:hypothetical protein
MAVLPESILEPLRQSFKGDLAVAGLRTFIADHDPEQGAGALQEPGPLPGPQSGGTNHVEDQFHPGVSRVGVLASWPTAGAKAPLQLRRRNDQAAANPKTSVGTHQDHTHSALDPGPGTRGS